ncbi:MAG: 4-hydroxy-tetrahydrodipicolinate synthase [Bacteroidota bacterium]
MKKNAEKFKGTGVAIITPFKKSGAIDFDAYGNLVDNIINNGVNFIVSLGTTGEASTLSKREKAALIEFSVKTIDNRVPLVIGIGGNSTSEVVSQVHSTLFLGVDAILSVCPYYNKPSQEGLYQHFKTIAEACPVSMILYTVPGRTASNLSANTTLRLANDFQNIIGIKEASGNFDQIFQVLKNRPEGFLLLSGDDGITLPLIAMGCDGVISVVANVFPAEFSKMVKLGLEDDLTNARKIHFQLIDMINSLFADGSPAGVKAALNIKNQCLELLRLPLLPVNREVYHLIQRLVSEVEKS